MLVYEVRTRANCEGDVDANVSAEVKDVLVLEPSLQRRRVPFEFASPGVRERCNNTTNRYDGLAPGGRAHEARDRLFRRGLMRLSANNPVGRAQSKAQEGQAGRLRPP